MSAVTRNDIIQKVGQHLRSGQLESAEQLLRNHLANDPDWLQAWQELAKLLASQGQYDRALEVSRAASQHHPRDPSAWSALAVVHLNSGQPDQATQHFIRAIILDPATLFAHEALGASSEPSQKADARTRRILRRSIILAPNLPRTRLAFAKHCLPLRRHLSDVARQTKRALILDPRSDEAAFLHGAVNVVEMSNLVAARYFRWARAIAPDNATVCYHLGQSAFLAANFELARNATQDALRLGSSEAKARFLLGRIHRARGEFDRAATELDGAVALDPQLAEPRRMTEWTVTMAHFRA